MDRYTDRYTRRRKHSQTCCHTVSFSRITISRLEADYHTDRQPVHFSSFSKNLAFAPLPLSINRPNAQTDKQTEAGPSDNEQVAVRSHAKRLGQSIGQPARSVRLVSQSVSQSVTQAHKKTKSLVRHTDCQTD